MTFPIVPEMNSTLPERFAPRRPMRPMRPMRPQRPQDSLAQRLEVPNLTLNRQIRKYFEKSEQPLPNAGPWMTKREIPTDAEILGSEGGGDGGDDEDDGIICIPFLDDVLSYRLFLHS